jgi:hypothetical protein
MRIGDKQYAAKQFFNVGHPGTSVTIDENKKHLRDELLRQQIAGKSIQKFSAIVTQRNVSAFGKCS